MLGRLNGDLNMAKRRNLKKEKAQRNLAYARKFRKRSNSRNYRNRRPANATDGNGENGEDGDDAPKE